MRLISVLITLAASVGACTAMPDSERRDSIATRPDAARVHTVEVSPGAPPIQAVVHYLNADAAGRESLRTRWSEAHANGNYHAGFRYALALAATTENHDTLRQAKTILETLLKRDALDNSEAGLARMMLVGLDNRLATLDARQTLIQEREALQSELQRARQQIEQLTRIEQELEPEPPPQ